MRRGLRVGRIWGVPLFIGWSWLVVVPVVGVALFAGIEPDLGGTAARTAVAFAGTLLLFASVVAHEAGHTVVARRRGLRVAGIVVFLFGGYSEMDLDRADPGDDIAVSMAGPVASMGLAVVTVAAAFASPETAGVRHTLALLGLVNIGVALFNLLPGYPLDGGRVVRALLIQRSGDARRADLLSARLGMILGLAIIAVSVVLSVASEPASLVAAPVGVLVLALAFVAKPEASPRAGDVMVAAPDPVGEREAASVVRQRADEGPIPVVAGRRVVGLAVAGRAGDLVAEIMDPVAPADIVDVVAPVEVVRRRLGITGRSVVVVERGRLVGLIHAEETVIPAPQTTVEEI